MTTALEIRPSSSPAVTERPPWNTLAPIALALTFVTVIGGLVCGHVALAQIRRTGERGRALALVAVVIGWTVVGAGAALVLGTAAIVLQQLVIRS